MLLLNSVLTILVLEKVFAVKLDAKNPVMKAVDSSDLNADKDIIVKISPDAIFKSFRAVVSSDYLRNLAEEFAQTAAAHFMAIIKGAEEKKFRQDKKGFNNRRFFLYFETNDSRPPNDTEDNLVIPPLDVKKKKENHLINKKEVLVLLREPAIDGDNLEQALSEEISDTTEGNTVRLKINGAYYKRHNIVVNPDLNSTEVTKTTKIMEALKITNTTTEKPKLTTQIPTK